MNREGSSKLSLIQTALYNNTVQISKIVWSSTLVGAAVWLLLVANGTHTLYITLYEVAGTYKTLKIFSEVPSSTVVQSIWTSL